LRYEVPNVLDIENSVTELPAAAAAELLGDWMLRHSDLDAATMKFLEDNAKAAAPTSTASLQLAGAYLRTQKPEFAKPRLEAGCTLPAASFGAAMVCGNASLLTDADLSTPKQSDKETDELALRARKYFEDALRLAPGNVEAMTQAAFTYRTLDGESAALRAGLQKAFEIDPRNPLLATSLATILQHSNPRQTKYYLERAILNIAEPNQLQYMLEWLRAVESELAATASR
jgi:hypothetical protein